MVARRLTTSGPLLLTVRECAFCNGGLLDSVEAELSVFVDFGGEVTTVGMADTEDFDVIAGECDGLPDGLLDVTKDIVVFDLKNGRGLLDVTGWWVVVTEDGCVVLLDVGPLVTDDWVTTDVVTWAPVFCGVPNWTECDVLLLGDTAPVVNRVLED